MRTMFEYGFQQEAWKPKLGLSLDDLVSAGTDIYGGYTEAEIAEEKRRAAEAAAAAAASQAQAARANAAAAAAGQPGTVLGIPTTYLVVGGVGLAVVALIIGLKK